jgi:hypothetical protein
MRPKSDHVCSLQSSTNTFDTQKVICSTCTMLFCAKRKIGVRHLSWKSFSSSVKEKIVNSSDVNAYAMKHEAFCRQSLMVPPAPSTYKKDDISRQNITNNLVNYLTWRKWDLQYLSNPYCFAMISHALTYPLTLASNALHFQKNMNHHLPVREDSTIRLCCVGARSEAYLPDHFWREFIHFCNLHSDSIQPSKWHIDFIGHDLPPKLSPREITLNTDPCPDLTKSDSDQHQNQECISSSLYMTFTSGLLHNHVHQLYKTKSVQDILSLWDGFVLYNPGIGHSNLESSWDPTLQFIFKTDQNVLITAHSDLDSQRDSQVLQKYIRKPGVSHVHNPFASLMAYEDPFPPEKGVQHFVRPNHSMLLI